MGDKNENYNNTNQSSVSNKKDCLGQAAIPGDLHQSTIVTCKCDKCGEVAATEVEALWSCKSYLTCYYYGCCWYFYQLFKAKDFTIRDAIHRCKACKKEIAHYESC